MKNSLKKEINHIGIYIQIVLFIALTILLFMAYFVDIMPVVQVVTALLLFAIAYNSGSLIKGRKWFVVIYLLAGLFSLVIGILGIIGNA